jgi:hypothetical protein
LNSADISPYIALKSRPTRRAASRTKGIVTLPFAFTISKLMDSVPFSNPMDWVAVKRSMLPLSTRLKRELKRIYKSFALHDCKKEMLPPCQGKQRHTEFKILLNYFKHCY